MKAYSIEWSRQAIDDLLQLSDWLTDEAGAQIADAYTDNIEAYANGLREFPHRGTPRDDLEPDLRTISYRGRTVIAYRVEAQSVVILRVVHAGRGWEAE